MIDDFSVHNGRGVRAARNMIDDGWFEHIVPDQYAIEAVFDRLSEHIESIG